MKNEKDNFEDSEVFLIRCIGRKQLTPEALTCPIRKKCKRHTLLFNERNRAYDAGQVLMAPEISNECGWFVAET
jgi:hypothetical protein